MNKCIVALIAAAAMTLSFSASAFAATGTVERSVKFRSAPTANSSAYQTLTPGTSLSDVSQVNAWWYKASSNGKTGYVAASYVKLASTSTPPKSPKPAPSPAPSPAPANAKADKVVADAMALLGKVHYVYGKNAPPSTMDCSAFTKYVFGREGVTLRWGTKYQKDAGSYVDRANLKAGDLVFFRIGSSAGIGHVGIYIGNSQFIHNSPSNNGGVGITSLTSSYWKDRYVTARRVL